MRVTAVLVFWDGYQAVMIPFNDQVQGYNCNTHFTQTNTTFVTASIIDAK